MCKLACFSIPVKESTELQKILKTDENYFSGKICAMVGLLAISINQEEDGKEDG